MSSEPIDASQVHSETTSVWYLNHYHCPSCGLDWQDEWDCGCNDHCPSCHQEIVAYQSDLIEP